jgi:hypothetical protein
VLEPLFQCPAFQGQLLFQAKFRDGRKRRLEALGLDWLQDGIEGAARRALEGGPKGIGLGRDFDRVTGEDLQAEPDSAIGPEGSSSLRFDAQGPKFAIPRRPIGTHQHGIRLTIAHHFFLLGIPDQLAAQPQRNVGKMASRGYLVSAL